MSLMQNIRPGNNTKFHIPNVAEALINIGKRRSSAQNAKDGTNGAITQNPYLKSMIVQLWTVYVIHAAPFKGLRNMTFHAMNVVQRKPNTLKYQDVVNARYGSES